MSPWNEYRPSAPSRSARNPGYHRNGNGGCDAYKRPRDFRGCGCDWVASARSRQEDQSKDKRVESPRVPCLDEGSTPSSSTDMRAQDRPVLCPFSYGLSPVADPFRPAAAGFPIAGLSDRTVFGSFRACCRQVRRDDFRFFRSLSPFGRRTALGPPGPKGAACVYRRFMPSFSIGASFLGKGGSCVPFRFPTVIG